MAVCLFRSVVVMLFCMILSFAWNNADKYDHSIDDRKERLLTQLFPNRTNPYNTKERHALRKLPITKTPVSEDYVACIVCKEADMDACSILTGLLIQEVYYPHDLGFSESCKVVESLGARMESEIFGVGRTFRDTPQCREIVMQYLCLFFGSNNGMYKNYCVFHEDYTGDKTHWLLAPRPPCKSFCVQVAMVCANDMDFIQTCNEIECPQDDGDCTADPIINNSPLDAKLGCDVPYYKDPYAPKSAAAAPLRPGSTGAGLASLVLYGVVLLSSVMYLGFV